MSDLGDDTDSAAKDLDEFSDAVEDAGRGSADLGSLFSGLMTGLKTAGIVTGIKAVVDGIVDLEESTREYRTEQGKLNAAFESSNFSAETAAATYKSLQAVIGETDQSVEAAQQIALLADSEESAGRWASYAAGLVGKFGDALQPETFYESANETLKLGEATGAFAQMLEGCGFSVEQFNADLAACTTEQEKQALMLAITDQALGSAAESYRETNAETIRANEANEAWNETMAEIGGAIGPVITDIKLMGAEFVSGLVPAIQSGVAMFSDGLAVMQSVTEDVLAVVHETTEERLSKMRAAYEENGGGMAGAIAASMSAVEGFFTDGWNVVDKLTGGKLSAIRDDIATKMEEAKQKVGSIIEGIKGFFGFEFQWPKLKMPHFSVQPEGWEIGDLLKGSIPRLGISWYKEGGILPSAAIFGAYGGNLLGGGEAGKEAILPLDSFYHELDMIMGKYSHGISGMVVNVNVDSIENISGDDIQQLAVRVADEIYAEVARREAAI